MNDIERQLEEISKRHDELLTELQFLIALRPTLELRPIQLEGITVDDPVSFKAHFDLRRGVGVTELCENVLELSAPTERDVEMKMESPSVETVTPPLTPELGAGVEISEEEPAKPIDITQDKAVSSPPIPIRDEPEEGTVSVGFQPAEDEDVAMIDVDHESQSQLTTLNILSQSQSFKPTPVLPSEKAVLISLPAPQPTPTLFSFPPSPPPSPTKSDLSSQSPTSPRAYPTLARFNPGYTLPPLSALPPEYNRKGKPAKLLKKREREREKEKDKEKDKNLNALLGVGSSKEEWVPLGVARWGAILRANPVWKRVARAQKCLSSRDWAVAFSELRLIRALERIEGLKDTGRWALRQPKKQRGVGGLAKSHWDYLMDEMKWMRIDFREERRWKLTLAYTLANAVLEWHAAPDHETRLKLGICVRWRPPEPRYDYARGVMVADDMLEGNSEPVVQSELPSQPEARQQPQVRNDLSVSTASAKSLLMVDYGSDDDDDTQSVIDALDASVLVQDAIEASNAPSPSLPPSPIPMKLEEENDTVPPACSNDATNVDLVPTAPASQQSTVEEQKPNLEVELTHPGLKPTSSDPMLGTASDIDSTSRSSFKPAAVPSAYIPIREAAAYAPNDSLFFDLDEALAVDFSTLSTSDPLNELPPPTDLSSLFPDLQPLGMPDVAPFPQPTLYGSTDIKKSAARRIDRDDPNRRAEDTTYAKLTAVTRLMNSKFTLLGPLQPSRHWKGGEWGKLEESPVVPEAIENKDDPVASDLFDTSRMPANPQVFTQPPSVKDQRKRSSDVTWSPEDDAVLRILGERYPGNWALVADAFNSARGTISTDRRTHWDCAERWNAKWGAPGRGGVGTHANAGAGGSSGLTGGEGGDSVQMTTRGVKRLASVGLSLSGGGAEPRKRRRHLLMQEAIRKAAKKRESTMKANISQRKLPVIHDSHNQFNSMPKRTPSELSRLKADKEAKDGVEVQRRRHEEMARQQLLQQGQQRTQGVPTNLTPQQAQLYQQQQAAAAQAQAAAAAAQANGTRTPSGGIPAAQGVPQIRSQVGISISQQQRLPASGAQRMSPQQVLQVQQAQARVLAVQAQQGQTGQVPVPTQNGSAHAVQQSPSSSGIVNGVGQAHLFNARAATSSPSLASPPRATTTPTGADPVQAHPAGQQQGVAGPAVTVSSTSSTVIGQGLSHYFPQGQYTAEQALQLQLMQRQRQQSTGGGFPQV